MTGSTDAPDPDGESGPDALDRVEARARRVEREAVERACSRLAARGEVTPKRRRTVAALAARLRARLVDDVVARAAVDGSDESAVDPEVVAALFDVERD
ncbi:hypothetical protein [Haloarchaeobius sp. HRN-SO-5]|uniref:hypothetical protein n=1 Tax=Haloarchaeobius sp. HRN-SO-5 TaxID=3446118 RepID=UPI003EC12431